MNQMMRDGCAAESPASIGGWNMASPTESAGAEGAVAQPVPSVIGLAKLAQMGCRGEDMMGAYQYLAARLAQDDTDVAPLMDVAILDQLLGQPERGLMVQTAALQAQRLFQLSSDTHSSKLKLLGFVMPGPISANIPIEFLIEDSDVMLYLLYIVPGFPIPAVPEHDLAIVLVAESETARPILSELERLALSWPRPVLNLPDRVPLLGRESLCQMLSAVPGVEIPATVRIGAATFAAIGSGAQAISAVLPDGDFPIIARPIDSHGGHGLDKIDGPADIGPYLSRNPVAEYFLSRFVDYRDPDGFYRKYRIAVIDGVPYPSHLAISDHWMIHFLNAGMDECADKRREEEQFMDTFADEFASRHGRALAEIAARSGLEYFGVDCGETRDGKLLVFEADTSLVVHNMDSATEFPYKARHMRALFGAFREMLYLKAGCAHK